MMGDGLILVATVDMDVVTVHVMALLRQQRLQNQPQQRHQYPVFQQVILVITPQLRVVLDFIVAIFASLTRPVLHQYQLMFRVVELQVNGVIVAALVVVDLD